jgi:Domain of unknown function (DUF5666)
MTRRSFSVVALLIVLFSIPLAAPAATHRAVMPPSDTAQADVLGIGVMSGSAVSGSVAGVQGSVITLNSGGAAPIRIDASTAKFMSDHGGAAAIGDVKAGLRITAFINPSTTPAAGASLSAQLIVIESLPDLTVTGPVQSIDVANSKFTILGITIAVDANTSYGGSFPTFAPISNLGGIAVGQVVNVTAAFAGGAILARSVQVIAPAAPPYTVLGGTVKSISATAWVITGKDGKDTTVTVNAQTKIIGDPKVGDSVQVMASIDSAHNYVAIAIVKLNMPVTSDLHGWVASIAPTQWAIGGPPGSMAPVRLVKITPSTVIYANPQVGDHVTATGTSDSTGMFTATKITKD